MRKHLKTLQHMSFVFMSIISHAQFFFLSPLCAHVGFLLVFCTTSFRPGWLHLLGTGDQPGTGATLGPQH